MKLLDAISGRTATPPNVEQRYGMDWYAQMLFDGRRYLVGPSGSRPDEIDGNFVDYIHNIHRKHGVVAAAVATRALLLSQVRFKWRRPDGSLYGTQGLGVLERPGSMTRPALLSMLEHDASYSGTAIVAKRRGQLWRLAPDKTTFVLGSNSDPTWDGDVMVPPWDTEVTGVIYNAGHGRGGMQGQVEAFRIGEFAVWAPEPDPVYFWKGTSWVSSVVREVLLDGQATDQSSKYFENGSIPSLVFMMDDTKTPEQLKEYQSIIDERHGGVRNRYKNLFLGGATDVKVVGTSLDGAALGHIQGTFENRVAVRSRIPAVVLGTKESLSGSSLNAGNYQSSRRLLADGWFTPTVDGLCAALESIVPPPNDGSELGHDPSRILFLQEDMADQANIMQTNAVAMRQLVEAGYEPSSVTEAITTGDMTKLSHTGNVSVQLQPPGSGTQSNSVDIVGEIRAAAVQPQLPFEIHNHVTERNVSMAPTFNVGTPDVRVENHVDVPEARIDAPVINVSPTPITVDNTVNVEPTPVTVENQIENHVDVAPAKVPPAQVTVMPSDQPAKFKVRRDGDGRISEVVED